MIQIRSMSSNNIETTCTIPQLGDIFPQAHASFVLHYDRYKLPRLNPFQILYCPLAFISGEHPNRSVASFVSSDILTLNAWPGTVLVLKYASMSCDGYVDISDADITDLHTYFSEYGIRHLRGSVYFGQT